MSRGSPLGAYRERLTYFKDTDAEKNDMINELIERLELSQAESQKTLSDLENEQASRRRLQDEVKELRTLTTRRAFALVLIDADADDYIFHERFLNRNEVGGKEAADELCAKVKIYLESLKLDAQNMDIVVRAYANLKGLRTACVRNGKMNQEASMGLFAQGFTRRQPLFDFVDVGQGKEEADTKIKECLKFYVGNVQCKHIVLGVCHDAGYGPYLEQFASDRLVRDRITLLEGAAVNRRIAGLGFKKPLRLDTVFAPCQPPNPPAASSLAPEPSSRLGPPLFDEIGRRVDRFLNIDQNHPFFRVVRDSNLCGWHYLRGNCEKPNCERNHSHPPLTESQFNVLWFMTRKGSCYAGKHGVCRDALCIYGHQ